MGKQEAVRRLSATISLRSEARLQANSDALLESVECKVFVVKLETSLPHFLAQGFIVEEKGYFLGKLFGLDFAVLHLYNKAIETISHDLRYAAHVGRNDGQFVLHGF